MSTLSVSLPINQMTSLPDATPMIEMNRPHDHKLQDHESRSKLPCAICGKLYSSASIGVSQNDGGSPGLCAHCGLFFHDFTGFSTTTGPHSNPINQYRYPLPPTEEQQRPPLDNIPMSCTLDYPLLNVFDQRVRTSPQKTIPCGAGVTPNYLVPTSSFGWKSASVKEESTITTGKTKHRGSTGPSPDKFCQACNKTFTRARDLKRHIMAVHQKRRPHKCSLCPKKFATKSGLNRHVSGVHAKEMAHECHICHRKFNQRCSLTRHMKVHAKFNRLCN